MRRHVPVAAEAWRRPPVDVRAPAAAAAAAVDDAKQSGPPSAPRPRAWQASRDAWVPINNATRARMFVFLCVAWWYMPHRARPCSFKNLEEGAGVFPGAPGMGRRLLQKSKALSVKVAPARDRETVA